MCQYPRKESNSVLHIVQGLIKLIIQVLCKVPQQMIGSSRNLGRISRSNELISSFNIKCKHCPGKISLYTKDTSNLVFHLDERFPSDLQTEVDEYLKIPCHPEADPLTFWKFHVEKYPSSSAPVERLFSISDHRCDDKSYVIQ